MKLSEALKNPPVSERETLAEVGPKILVWDIENSPALGEFWGSPFNTNIVRIVRPSEVISFAAKWLGSDQTEFRSVYHDGPELMLERAWELLNEADGVVSYNGKNHDSLHITREFIVGEMGPPSPYIEIDLYRVVKQKARFQQNKLAFVAQELGIGGKVQHEGHALWVACGENDPDAWAKMREYNIQDVALTENLYQKLLPYIPQHMHPHPKLYGVLGDCCGHCGSNDVFREEDWFAYTALGKFERFQCRNCKTWIRGKKRKDTAVDLRSI